MKKVILAAAVFVLGVAAIAPSVIASNSAKAQNCCTTGASCCPASPCCK